MKKRGLCLLLPIVTLFLEALPYGAVCIFASSPTEQHRKTFSYFDLTPFGYANFAPFLTAVMTCVIFLLLTVFCLTGRKAFAGAAKNALFICIVLSLGPLLFGLQFFSVVGGLITLSLLAELMLLRLFIS